jgi:hypothetical protein
VDAPEEASPMARPASDGTKQLPQALSILLIVAGGVLTIGFFISSAR